MRWLTSERFFLRSACGCQLSRFRCDSDIHDWRTGMSVYVGGQTDNKKRGNDCQGNQRADTREYDASSPCVPWLGWVGLV